MTKIYKFIVKEEVEINETEKVEKGIITSTRKVFEIGGSKGITLSKKWVDIQRWLGKEVTELVSLSNSVIVLVPPGQEKKAREILKQIEAVSNGTK